MVRIYLRANGCESGVLAKLPDSRAKLLQVANAKLPPLMEGSEVFLRLFLKTGDELDDDDAMDLVNPDEII